MQPVSPPVQELIEDFQQRLKQRECFFQQAVAALAVDHMVQQLERIPKPPRQRRLLSRLCQLLVRGGQGLVSLIRKKGKPETRSRGVLDVPFVVINGSPDPQTGGPSCRPLTGNSDKEDFHEQQE